MARQVAARVAADQVAAQSQPDPPRADRRGPPGDDGLTSWWALLPSATSAAAVAALDRLAADYRDVDDTLTVTSPVPTPSVTCCCATSGSRPA